ncbi:SgcJ/EcaC family oxidoreductase [Rhodobacter sp. NTK016B]|uniref:YybH family protein n=1 Tax=Rhodobacter sp. NTK016B TaxID=2759676 RepID=UPI001A8DDEFA|nr:SgcJ/EcaC family oxidoreductase [Rhodobacter sp. NTK016B]MBN8291988.1 SgcJ/EcaC family oxidoreductase [Rhodobacter sp. NTK016B]
MSFLKILTVTLTSAILSAAPLFAQVATPRDAVAAMTEAVAARDADAVAALYAPDAAVFLFNGPILSGRDQVREIWARNFANGYDSLTVTRQRSETGSDRAALVMLWRATIAPPGQAPQQVQGRSLLYLVRVDGGWLISADMWQPGS